MEKENEIDQLFKRGLSDPEIPFQEMDWEKMERKLDAQKKKRILPVWLYTASGVAAALLIFLSWYFLTPSANDHKPANTQLTTVHVTPKINQEPSLKAKELDTLKISHPDITDQKNAEVLSKSLQISPAPAKTAPAALAMQPAKTEGPYAALKPAIPVVIPENNIQPFTPQKKGVTKDQMIDIPVNSPQTALVNAKTPQNIPETDSARVVRTANALAQSKDPFEKINKAEIERSVKKKMDASLQQQGHSLVLSAMAAPDISSAKSSKPAKVSSDFGLVGSYTILHNVSVSSGALYAKKYYNYNSIYSDGQSWQVNADCNVLDVPVNVNYKIMNKKQLSISMTAGVSSYFMLKEKYDYVIGQGAAQQTTTSESYGQNQHIFGIANLGVSFDHQISQSVSIGIQPFAKLPLTGIGANNANLKSVGAFFSLNIGLFAPKKPGKYAALWK